MSTIKGCELSSIEFLLFNNEDGACERIDNISESDKMAKEFKLINDVISTINLENNGTEFLQFAIKFIKWGSKYVVKMLLKSMQLNRAKEIMLHIALLYDFLPDNSKCSIKTMITKEELINVLSNFQPNFKENPKDVITIFSKIWILCEKEIEDSIVFSMALNGIYVILTCTKFDEFIVDLFVYADSLLVRHSSKLETKIADTKVINGLLNIVKVVVRNDKHADARLHFWWKLICSMRADLICNSLFKPCVVPFLANLFGKYMSLDPDEKFPYSLHDYNCFSHYVELGALLNHVMTQLLRLVGGTQLTHVEKPTKYDIVKHWWPYFNKVFTAENLNTLLIAFYYWCQTTPLNRHKTAPTTFGLLITVFGCFSERFLVSCQLKQQSFCRSENNVENLTPMMYSIVDKIIIFKNRLALDSGPVIFSEKTKVMKTIIDSLSNLGDNTSLFPVGLQFLLRVLCAHFSDMDSVIKSGIEGYHASCSIWLDSCKSLIDLIFPKNSMAVNLIVYRDMHMINQNWFDEYIHEKNLKLKISNNFSKTNLQCWFHLSTKLSHRLDRDSFETFSDEINQENLTPFGEYLVVPIVFMMNLNQKVMTKFDYDELWKLWEYLYTDLVNKYNLVRNARKHAWITIMLPLLSNMFTRLFDLEKTSFVKLPLVFNMICRCTRLVILKMEDTSATDITKNCLLNLFQGICQHFPIFSNGNFNLDIPAHSEYNNDGLFVYFTAPAGKTLKRKSSAVSKYLCDLNSNYDTFLSLIQTLIQKVVHDEMSALNMIELISPKLPLLSDSLVCRRLNNERFSKSSRARSIYDENTSKLENFIVILLNYVSEYCFKESVTTETIRKFSPLLLYIFSFDNKLLSRSTVQSAINFWNFAIADDDTPVEYPENLRKMICDVGMQNKTINVPKSMKETTSSKPDSQNESTIIQAQKTVIPQINTLPVSLKKPPTKTQPHFLGKQSSDADYVFISPETHKRSRLTEHQKESFIEKMDEYKPVMYNELDAIPKLSLISQDSETNISIASCDSFTRHNSIDIDKCLDRIDTPANTSFSDNNIDKTTVTNKLENAVIVDKDNLGDHLTQQRSNSVIVDKENPEIQLTRKRSNSLERIPLVNLNKNNVMTPNEISIVVSDINQDKRDTVPRKDSDICKIEQVVDTPAVEHIKTNESMEIDQTSIQPIDNSQIEENIFSSKTENIVTNTDKCNDSTGAQNEMSVSLDLCSPARPTNRFANYNSPRPLSATIEPSSIANSTSLRTRRIVQMAVNNQLKKGNSNKGDVSCRPNSEDKEKNSGIIRHLWSNRKKDAHVSFSIPIDNTDENGLVETDETIIDIDEKSPEKPTTPEKNDVKMMSFLSPVSERTRTGTPVVTPPNFELDLNDSFTEESAAIDWDHNSAERVRRSLEKVVQDLSPIHAPVHQICDEFLERLKPAMDAVSQMERVQIAKKLMKFMETNL